MCGRRNRHRTRLQGRPTVSRDFDDSYFNLLRFPLSNMPARRKPLMPVFLTAAEPLDDRLKISHNSTRCVKANFSQICPAWPVDRRKFARRLPLTAAALCEIPDRDSFRSTYLLNSHGSRQIYSVWRKNFTWYGRDGRPVYSRIGPPPEGQ